MAHLYTRYLEILKRWPVDELRTTYCFGKYLRASSPKWFTLDGRVIGSSEDCEHRLKSLERLADNYYKNKYTTSPIRSVTGMNVEECRKTLVEDYSESKGIVQQIISKFSFSSSKKR